MTEKRDRDKEDVKLDKEVTIRGTTCSEIELTKHLARLAAERDYRSFLLTGIIPLHAIRKGTATND